jgi:hypothetical protein
MAGPTCLPPSAPGKLLTGFQNKGAARSLPPAAKSWGRACRPPNMLVSLGERQRVQSASGRLSWRPLPYQAKPAMSSAGTFAAYRLLPECPLIGVDRKRLADG